MRSGSWGVCISGVRHSQSYVASASRLAPEVPTNATVDVILSLFSAWCLFLQSRLCKRGCTCAASDISVDSRRSRYCRTTAAVTGVVVVSVFSRCVFCVALLLGVRRAYLVCLRETGQCFCVYRLRQDSIRQRHLSRVCEGNASLPFFW